MASVLQLELDLGGINMAHFAPFGFTPGTLLASGCQWEAGCNFTEEIGKVEIVPPVDQQVLDFSGSLLFKRLAFLFSPS